MAHEIAMPQMGVTMEAGTILKWLKQVGDPVRKEEPIMEIQTDKVNLEITSDVEGTLLAILVGEGREVPVGTVLAHVGQPGEQVAVEAAAPPPPPAGRVRATPAARSRARSYGISLEAITGSGPAGRIQARDVEAARATEQPVQAPAQPAPAPAPTAPPAGEYRDLPVAGMRKLIAQRLAHSFHSTVPVLLTAEATMDRADELLAQLGRDLERQTGGRVGYLPLLIKAVAVALRAHPHLNAHWLDEQIRLFNQVHMGVAVALEEGLAVPVLREADRKGIAAIATELSSLVTRARQSSLALTDLEGGTFTISNLGAYQIGHFAPVINPPQVAILGVGRAVIRPVVRHGQILALPVLPLSLVFDHRAVDGAPAAAFLDAVKAGLEEPYRMLM